VLFALKVEIYARSFAFSTNHKRGGSWMLPVALLLEEE
jgi:hypothetical protein